MAAPQKGSWLESAKARARQLAAVVLFPDMPRRDPSLGQVGISVQDNMLSWAAAVPRTDGHFRITQCGFRPLPKQADLAAWLQRQLDDLGLTEARCHFVLSPDHYQLLQVEAPDVPEAELRDALRWRIRELVDTPVEDAVLDVYELPQPASAHRAGKTMLGVVASPKKRVSGVVSLFARTDEQLEVIDVADLALRNLCAQLPEDDRGVALLLPGESSSLMLVCRDRTLHLSRRLQKPLPDLAGLPAPSEDAEIRLAATGSGLDFVVIRSLEYYENHFQRPPVAAVYVAPTPRVNDPGPLCAHLAESLGLPVKPLALGDVLDCAVDLDGERQAHCLFALGAALRREERVL